MKDLKPYLFWVITGAILILEIAWWLLSIPDIDVVGHKNDAQQAKTKLDAEYTNLKELEQRARNGSPNGVFDAEKESDIKRLTDEYLITPAWREILEPHVARYDEQLKQIKLRLADRSKNLDTEIASSADKFAWYTAYQERSAAVLRSLLENRALTVPPAKDEAAGYDFVADANLRTIAGFFTKSSELPDPSLHLQLTRQLHITERIAAVLIETKGQNLPCQQTAISSLTPESSRAALVSLSWSIEGVANANQVGGEAGRYATGLPLTVTIKGSLSSVITAAAALDRTNDPKAPIMITTGMDITRPTFAPGERKDVGEEPVLAKLSLLVLDFSHAVEGVAPVAAPSADAPSEQAPPAKPKKQKRPSSTHTEGGDQ